MSSDIPQDNSFIAESATDGFNNLISQVAEAKTEDELYDIKKSANIFANTLFQSLEQYTDDDKAKNDLIVFITGQVQNIENLVQKTIIKIGREEKENSESSKPKQSKGRRLLKTTRRIGYFTASLPILLPILCICIAGLILLAAISSLTGGGPDQTQNMQALQEECREAGDCRTLLLNKIRERGVDNN